MRTIPPALGLLAAVLAVAGPAGRGAESGWPADAAGALTCTATFPTDRAGQTEPLLAVGRGGEGDVIFVHYDSAQRISLGWEQIGWGVVFSDPVDVIPGRPHRLMFVLGSLMPPAGAPPYAAHPEWVALRQAALVQLDGRTVLTAHGTFAPFVPGRVFAGRNVVGGAVAGAFFTGHLADFSTESLAAAFAAGSEVTSFLAPKESAETSAGGPSAAQAGYPGPLLIRLRFPRGRAGQSEPLVVTGRTGAGDIVYVRYLSDRTLRFGFDHWSKGGPVSGPVEIDPDETQEIRLSLGSLLPSAPAGGPDPYAALRERCVLYLNGRLVLNSASSFYPTRANEIRIAVNPIGGSTAGPTFSGVVIHAESVRMGQFDIPAP